MKIVVCASMSAAGKMTEVQAKLERLGHEVILPTNIDLHTEKLFSSAESTQKKVEHDLIRGYFQKISESDAILVLNYDKDGIANYIGSNTFLEIGFAHVLLKDIFILNPLPNLPCRDEIMAMQPRFLGGNLGRIG